MKKQHQYIVLIVVFVLLLVALYMYRSKEPYVLPDFTNMGTTSNICPPMFVLTCVSSNVQGISQTIPFPSTLPQPCANAYVPLCLPHPRYLRAANQVYQTSNTSSPTLTCPAGQYLVGNNCVMCTPGTFSLGGTISSCTQCTSNTFSNIVGATSCTPCPPGTHSTPGSSRCSS